MTALRTFLSRLFGWLGGRQREENLRREIESHIAEAADEYVRQGLTPRRVDLTVTFPS